MDSHEKTSVHAEPPRPFVFPEVGVPFLWPLGCALDAETARLDLMRRSVSFLREFHQTQIERPAPAWTTPGSIRCDLTTLRLRDFSVGRDAVPTLIVAPYAGHSSTIADFHHGQSLVEAFIDEGVGSVAVTDWKSATPEMRHLAIDAYLAELAVCVEELGPRVNLVGLCQGGWLSAMLAARFPMKVASLVLAGAPINTDVGRSQIRECAHAFPMSFFERLVEAGGGTLRGTVMLVGFKGLHPGKHYVEKFVELYENIDDPGFLERFRKFEAWYQHTIDLPGAFYLQAIRELFKENRLVRGEFVALGRTIRLADIRCPLTLLAGESDDITPAEQVLSTAMHVGTPPDRIVRDIAPGGHIGLFMGRRAVADNWRRIARRLIKPCGNAL
jgi:poly(3-hydroxybutyrate) depolymerase